MKRTEYPFYLDISMIVGIDARGIEEAEKKMPGICKKIAKALEKKVPEVLQLAVYGLYNKEGTDGKFKVAGEKSDEH